MPHTPEQRRDYERQKKAVKVQAMRDYLGGVCVECGSPEVDIHHKDPASKCFNPTQRWTKSWTDLTAELDKCELRCHTHHKQEHLALHGTLSKYTNNGCRCEPCVEVYRSYIRERDRKRRAKRKLLLQPVSHCTATTTS